MVLPTPPLTPHSLYRSFLMPSSATKVFSVELLDDLLIVSPTKDVSTRRYNDIHTDTNSITGLLQRSNVRYLLIDFSDIEIIGSLMISAIIKIARQHGDQKRMAAFCGASEHVEEVFRAMNLMKLWPCFGSREEAVESFGC
jgi:anti-anti-sigma regulatory factor